MLISVCSAPQNSTNVFEIFEVKDERTVKSKERSELFWKVNMKSSVLFETRKADNNFVLRENRSLNSNFTS